MTRKGQMTFEHLTMHAYAGLVLVTALGVLFYFGLFDMDTYTREYCYFDANLICKDATFNDWSFDSSKDMLNLRLQNNMNDNILINQTVLINEDTNTKINCNNGFANLYCRYNESNAPLNFRYIWATPYTNTNAIYTGIGSKWAPQIICNHAITCPDEEFKENTHYKVLINFSREGGSTIHQSIGRFYIKT